MCPNFWLASIPTISLAPSLSLALSLSVSRQNYLKDWKGTQLQRPPLQDDEWSAETRAQPAWPTREVHHTHLHTHTWKAHRKQCVCVTLDPRVTSSSLPLELQLHLSLIIICWMTLQDTCINGRASLSTNLNILIFCLHLCCWCYSILVYILSSANTHSVVHGKTRHICWLFVWDWVWLVLCITVRTYQGQWGNLLSHSLAPA